MEERRNTMETDLKREIFIIFLRSWYIFDDYSSILKSPSTSYTGPTKRLCSRASIKSCVHQIAQQHVRQMSFKFVFHATYNECIWALWPYVADIRPSVTFFVGYSARWSLSSTRFCFSSTLKKNQFFVAKVVSLALKIETGS